METRKRSIVKTISWRVAATLITGVVTYFLTGRLDFAVTVGLTDTLVKFFIYYVHERMWTRISYGKVRPLDYQI
ncbi:MAG: hypothetical protein A2559_09125 [Deltaproteobacteria bacterium RIFOXYD2_FULL_66_9]|nr:MAG: hypothetical protein A3K53_04850 [Deltaproteobacteria bacterium RIFOXYB2_FULL_66_7]OGR21143.1 MAG: hypothetical protein A2559_09125 [Deltaproteobacteria bacterium RIFOXYD2_FULL_66_9]